MKRLSESKESLKSKENKRDCWQKSKLELKWRRLRDTKEKFKNIKSELGEKKLQHFKQNNLDSKKLQKREDKKSLLQRNARGRSRLRLKKL
jgi:hypothetical protein